MTNKQRILAISKKLGLSHIGSNLSCLPILEEIYAKKKIEDIVILDNAHAHLAHLVVKDEWFRKQGFWLLPDMEKVIKDRGIHCDKKAGCDASGGSLGHGIGIAIGYALANLDRSVYVIVSDGSMMEGSNWEALRIYSESKLHNLHIHCNFNGYSAVSKINLSRLEERMRTYSVYIQFHRTDNTPEFDGIEGHYKKI